MDYAAMIDNMFKYHKANDDHVQRMNKVREGSRTLAVHIDEQTPDGPEKTLALRSLHECVKHANYAIVTGG